MEVFEAIKKRRSIRSFNSNKKVSDAQIEKILEAGRLAPSAHNLQDWFFIVVKDQDKKDKLVGAAAGQSFVGEASIVIVICADLRLTDRHSSSHGQDFFMIQDTAIAATQMWLAATSLGLGACWVGAFDEEEIKRVLNLEEHFRPVALLSIGYPAESPKPPSRRSIKKISKII